MRWDGKEDVYEDSHRLVADKRLLLVIEGLVASALVLPGIPFETAVVMGLLDHTAKKLSNLVFGLPATAQLGIKLTQIRRIAGGRPNEGQ